jgi:hypothetical protein
MFNTRSQFCKPKETEQQPNEAVDITSWAIGGSFAYYPDGTRAKFEVFCTSDTPYKFLIPRHRYLFKKTFERKGGVVFYEQFWTEIIAYKIGRALGIEVPPAFLAKYHDPVRGLEYASLIEWYYNYPGDIGCKVDKGGDFMSRAIPEYDREKGKLHNFQTITDIFTDWLEVKNWQHSWAEILLFDAIIGNTDRHQENWEIYSYFDDKGNLVEKLSPAFDNGTAMGYEIQSQDFAKRLGNLEAYINKGTHHMKWALGNTKNAGHFELLQKLVTKFPETESIIKNKLSIDITAVYNDILQLTEFNIDDSSYVLTIERANFIIKLIEFRYNKAKKIFGV